MQRGRTGIQYQVIFKDDKGPGRERVKRRKEEEEQQGAGGYRVPSLVIQ
jgi:hypothetical protein